MTGAARVWFMGKMTKLGEAVVQPAEGDLQWVLRNTPVGPPAGWSFGKLAPANGAGGLSDSATLSWG